MGTMRMMLETICEKQTVALRMVLDEAYKILDKDKAREDSGAAAAADGAAQATKDVPVAAAGTTANGAAQPEAGQDTAAHEQEEEHELL